MHFTRYAWCVPGRLVSNLHIKSWLNDFWREDNASKCRSASTHLYTDWLVVSLINQVDSTCASIMFSVSFLIAGWLLVVGDDARRCLDALVLPGWSETVCAPERRQPTMEKLPGDWENTRRQCQSRSRMITPMQARFLVLFSQYYSTLIASIRTGRFITGCQYSSQMRAVLLNQLLIDVLGCGDPMENVTQTVTLSTLTGTMGAHHGLDRDTIGWSYRPACVC